MCLRPKLDNSDNAFASSVALGCASCHLLYSCIIAILSNFRPNLRDRNQYFIKLGPSASLRAIRMCLHPKLDNSNNALASLEALSCVSCHLLCLCIITIFSSNQILVKRLVKNHITHPKGGAKGQPIYLCSRCKKGVRLGVGAYRFSILLKNKKSLKKH